MDTNRGAPPPRHRFAEAAGLRLHYVEAGEGVPIVLLHGFPKTWREWLKLVPLLSRRYRVILPDLPGAGSSAKPADGYDKIAMAGAIAALVAARVGAPVHIVGHDIGGMVAYALAATHPDLCRSLTVLDVPLPGSAAWDRVRGDPRAWHIGFHAKRDLPERLIAAREYHYVRAFVLDRAVDPGRISKIEIARAAKALAAPGNLRGALGWYRALERDAADNLRLKRVKLRCPVLALGGARRWGPAMVAMMGEFADDVTGGAIEDCDHWIADEAPFRLADRLTAFIDAVEAR